jgi:glycine/D-amino acid oxidase-like deaminating enzyme
VADVGSFAVMGFSSDGFPFVDHVPGKPGQLVCAGFSGHGMPQIFLSAQAIASMALGDRSPAEVGLPRLYSISKERMESKRNDTLDEWGSLYGKEAAKL